MGNTLQCTPYSTTSSYTIKVVHSNANASGGGGGCSGGGVVEHYASPATRVADLLLDHPGQFVCDAAALAVGHRVPALPADEPLSPCRLYFLLPTDLLYSILTVEEATALSCMAKKIAKKKKKKKKKRRSSCSSSSSGSGSVVVRIFPAALGDRFCLLPAGEAATDEAMQGEERILRRRRRPWRPALDTIEEVA